jgi:hypothetical protein
MYAANSIAGVGSYREILGIYKRSPVTIDTQDCLGYS